MGTQSVYLELRNFAEYVDASASIPGRTGALWVRGACLPRAVPCDT
jgi:hypothetical protein